MKTDDKQFCCADCIRYQMCQYYHRRKKESNICKFFHLFPDNATNGDVIKAMFPNCIDWVGKYEDSTAIYVDFHDGRIKAFMFEWWNEPYKGGKE